MALSVFRWVPEGWRECTKKCGGGKQKRKIMCRQKTFYGYRQRSEEKVL